MNHQKLKHFEYSVFTTILIQVSEQHEEIRKLKEGRYGVKPEIINMPNGTTPRQRHRPYRLELVDVFNDAFDVEFDRTLSLNSSLLKKFLVK